MKWLIFAIVNSSLALGQSVSADFHNRDKTTPAIPASWQGVNDMHHLDAVSTKKLTVGGINVSRLSLQMQQIYPSGSTPDFSVPDAQADQAVARGYRILGYIQNTPPDLGASVCLQPSSVSTWASRAAAIIAHEEARNPGVFVGWGVWNEEDLTGSYCPSSGTNISNFITLYAAAAPAMIAQVITDGSTALVGPGGLGAPGANAATFFANTSTGLLGNSGTSPYVQYVESHSYIGGCTVSWSACFTALQDALAGQTAIYASVNTLVRAGGQPNASTTPLIIGEYNDSALFSSDPVRNDTTNGPIWNSVSISDWLNSSPIPQGIWYYNSGCTSTPTFFGLFGSSGGSACTPLNPYPQLYLYLLTGSLGLYSGSHLATSLSPASSTSGLQGTAWYNSAGDTFLLTNPTASPISSGVITFTNAGMTPSQAAMFTLNGANQPPIETFLSPSCSGGNCTLSSVSIPAMSAVTLTLVPVGVSFAASDHISGGWKFQ